MQTLSVVIIALNEADRISECIRSVKDIAGEIVVVDSGSTDGTTEVCRELGCSVLSHPFEGFSKQKQFAVDQAVCDWILSIDADEIVSPELSSEIVTILGRDQHPFNGYWIPLRFIYLGRQMKRGRLGHEVKLRLFRRGTGRLQQVSVHEDIVVEGPAGLLKGFLYHHSYRSISHHIEKINYYTDRAAEGNAAKGKRFGKWWVALKFPVSFFTFYFIKGGVLEGYPGFIWSFFAAFYGVLKISKTIEKTSVQH